MGVGELGEQRRELSALGLGAGIADDPLAQQVIHETAGYLGGGIADLANLVDPGRAVAATLPVAAFLDGGGSPAAIRSVGLRRRDRAPDR